MLAVTWGLAGLGASRVGLAQEEFVRGDVNVDGEVSISDAVMLRRFLFNGGRPPTCMDAADVDDNGGVDISDPIGILRQLFLGGPPFPAPAGEPGPDPTEDGIGCASFDVVEPEETDDLLRLGEVTAAPGEEVEVPVFVTNSVEVEAFQLVVRFDPDRFTPKGNAAPGRVKESLSLDGTFYEGLDPPAGSFASVHVISEEDVFVIAFIPDFLGLTMEFMLPPGEETLAFKIRGTIPETAPAGTTTTLEPTNGPSGGGVGPEALRNEFTHAGAARFVSTLPQLEGNLLNIVGDQTFFLRGDSNSDGAVDLSDARFTLDFLFLAGTPPACPDAADANDDGRLDISDPIKILTSLFVDGGPLPAPSRKAGSDPTQDPLGCG
ncbi:MAG: dockerin type I domain-containing protein [Planctomycetota bacterium]|nr:dockerin type I domain-containing protein [Planctomycetota bacterium]